MWTPERTARLAPIPPAAELGQVTLSGDPAGVSLGGERRWLPVYSPGGYCWKPAAGDRVLVLHTGPDQELPCAWTATSCSTASPWISTSKPS